jgi:hypothetical protein
MNNFNPVTQAQAQVPNKMFDKMGKTGIGGLLRLF